MNLICEQLEHIASTYPNKVAAIDSEHRTTWKELQEGAMKAGSFFVSHHVERNEPVVLMVEKSVAALMLMYGVVYSGGFYVFVDPKQPAIRLAKILNTLQAKVIVAEESDFEVIHESGYDKALYTASEVLSSSINKWKLHSVKSEDGDPLYAVFTSGSTGEPKGVVVSKESVYRFIHHFIDMSGICEKDILANQAPFDFDVSVKDLYSSLFTGATVVLVPKAAFAMPKLLMDLLCDEHVTVLVWAVSALCIITTFKGFDYRLPKDLRMVMFSGEVMPLNHLTKWQQTLSNVQYINLYGPSEITCNCTYYKIDGDVSNLRTLPIGIPFEGREILLLDENMQRVTEPDHPGQIAVQGESLAIGYYNRPEITNKAFVMIDGKRTYLTGDIGSFKQDGLLYFAGRADSQIKHMGHRIELGEVEAAMVKEEGVERACCIYDHEKNRIYGYYTGTIDETQLRKNLKEYLPTYMIPNKLQHISSFKLNQHGKIDRTALLIHA